MDTLSFPIRFVNGSVEKIQEGTDFYYGQLLALTTQIRPGELPLTPYYGVEDPVFDDESKTLIAARASYFIPEIDIDNVQIIEQNVGKSVLKVSFRVR
jgi:hypothetical protein